MTVSIRLLEAGDAATLAQLRVRNWAHLEPWEPTRPDSFFTEQGQRESIHQLLEAHAAGGALPMVVLGVSEALIGQVMLNSIIRGAFQSASLAYPIFSCTVFRRRCCRTTPPRSTSSRSPASFNTGSRPRT